MSPALNCSPPLPNAPRPLSLRARFLLWFYRHIVKARLAKPMELAKVQTLLTRLDRWLGGGGRGFNREHISARGVAADWIGVDAIKSGRVILYLHGGGFMFRTPRLHARLAARLCLTLGARTLMPHYRLAPGHPLPAAHEDCFAAYRWLLEQGQDPARIIVIGDSAGGLLTLATLQRIRDAGLPLPACAVMFSPGTCIDSIRRLDARATADDPMIGAGALELLQRVVVAEVAAHDPGVSPCAGSLHGLPPLLLQAGSTECLLHQSQIAVAQARNAGTHAELQVWPQMPHVWQAVDWLPEAQDALACVGEFVERHSHQPASTSCSPTSAAHEART
ncbi:alpha/beta hydrolase [Pseudomonas sp. TH41]|uniref:alpha/beta hydrolase n=1 Tax=Pseudomonas sp. TH41 TaxID=2796405 RepID=UPI0019121991|nr:alpha/beta hydrolase [Pseudomonas sp. TH41]MBK5356588.1 alpha/beta hydrolase [Pseudomonas sp. TH41]